MQACTCHPNEAPTPCAHQYALTECRRVARLTALADAYEPGMYALCDGVYHVYAGVNECCQTLRDDIRWALATRTPSLDGVEVKAPSLADMEHEARKLWGERQEGCAAHGAVIPMPTMAVPVDVLADILSRAAGLPDQRP